MARKNLLKGFKIPKYPIFEKEENDTLPGFEETQEIEETNSFSISSNKGNNSV